MLLPVARMVDSPELVARTADGDSPREVGMDTIDTRYVWKPPCGAYYRGRITGPRSRPQARRLHPEWSLLCGATSCPVALDVAEGPAAAI